MSTDDLKVRAGFLLKTAKNLKLIWKNYTDNTHKIFSEIHEMKSKKVVK